MQPPILWVVEAELFIPPSFSILKNLSQTMEWEGQLDPCVAGTVTPLLTSTF